MMGFGEEGEKGPFLKWAFSPPQVTTFIGNSAFLLEKKFFSCILRNRNFSETTNERNIVSNERVY